MLSLKNVIFFSFFLASFAPSANAILAPEHPAFIKEWTPFHQSLLSREPDGSFAIFQFPSQDGLYCLTYVQQGKLYAILFRHDDKYIKQASGFSIKLTKNPIADLDSLIEARSELIEPVSNDFNARAVKLKKDERNRIIAMHAREPWRAETMKSLRKEIISGKHRCEENDTMESMIEDLHRNKHITKEMVDEEMAEIFAITQEKNDIKSFFDEWFY